MHKLLSILLIFFYSHAFAADSIIKDSEIQEAINLVAKPILQAAKLDKIEIHLVNDNDLNAFTTGNNELYINIGLINQFQNIDVVRGVIAHEIGHILGKHIIRQSENIDNSNRVIMSSVALGLAAALASGNGGIIHSAILGGSHVAERSVLKHSRTFESSADQNALKLLEQSGYTCKGMIEFFEYMNRYNFYSQINRYDQTHPLSQERLTYIRNFYNNSKFKYAKHDEALEYKWNRAVAKLKAFTIEPKKIVSLLGGSQSEEVKSYIKAINYFRNGEINRAIKYIDQLIALRPHDPFYHELKGQILFEYGSKEALASYQIASTLRPNDLLIKLSKAIVGINIYSGDNMKIREFYQDLKFVYEKEPNNLTAIYYLTVFYEKVGLKYESLLYSAVLAYKTGQFDRAKRFAKQSIKGLQKGSQQWHKANDIIILLDN
jgi:predicted Zn-dependent protease